MEENKASKNLAGKRKYVKPIHVYGPNGEEILKCPYKNCSKSYSKKERKNMSHHMEIHKKNGTPLQCNNGIYGLINMAEKYIEPEEDKDACVSTILPVQEEEMKEPTMVDLENPITVADWEAVAEKRVGEVKLTCVEWDSLTDSEITETVSYVAFVKAFAKYVKYNGVYVKCTAARLTNLVTDELKNLKDTIGGAKNKVKVVEKLHKVVKEDINKALDIVVEKARVLEGVEGEFRQANYLRESVDIRKQICDNAQLTVQNAMNIGLIEFEKAWEKKADVKIMETVDRTMRVRESYGLPQVGVFDKPLVILSAQDKKEEEELLKSIPKPSMKAIRQLDAILDQLEPKRKLVRKVVAESVTDVPEVELIE